MRYIERQKQVFFQWYHNLGGKSVMILRRNKNGKFKKNNSNYRILST